MNADERGSKETTDARKFRGPNAACFAALDRLGYMPPQCIGVSIELPVREKARISIKALASPELEAFIESLQGRVDVTLRVADPLANTEEHGCRVHTMNGELIPAELREREPQIKEKAGSLLGICLEMKKTIRLCEVVGWLAMVLSVGGVLLNNARLWPCFLFWIASNLLSAWIHRKTSVRSLMVRDLIFFALACVGLWQWTR